MWKKIEVKANALNKEKTRNLLKAALRASPITERPRMVDEAKLVVAAINKLKLLGFDYSSAIPIIEKCLRVYNNAYGPDSIESIPVLGILASNKVAHNDDACVKQILSIIRIKRKHGPDDAETVYWLTVAGNYLLEHGKYSQAGHFFEEAQALAERIEGKGSIPYLTATVSRGTNYREQRKFADAEREFLKALSTLEPVRKNRAADYAEVLNYLANIYDMESRPEKGATLRKRAIETIKSHEQDKSCRAKLRSTLIALAMELMSNNRREEVLSLYKEIEGLDDTSKEHSDELAALKKYLKVAN
jgi:tetratricopeptide (TPR) repeat protein